MSGRTSMTTRRNTALVRPDMTKRKVFSLSVGTRSSRSKQPCKLRFLFEAVSISSRQISCSYSDVNVAYSTIRPLLTKYDAFLNTICFWMLSYADKPTVLLIKDRIRIPLSKSWTWWLIVHCRSLEPRQSIRLAISSSLRDTHGCIMDHLYLKYKIESYKSHVSCIQLVLFRSVG